MRVAGLGEPTDLGLGHPFAKDPTEVGEDESPAEGNQMKTEFAKPRDLGLKRIGPGHGGGAGWGVRQCHADSRHPMSVKNRLRGRAQSDLRLPIGISRDDEIRGLQRAERGFAGEELAAGFLGGEPRGEAGHPALGVAGVMQFHLGEEARQFLGRHGGEQSFEARDFDGINPASDPRGRR